MIRAVTDPIVEALFVSYLQPSQAPSADAVDVAVTATLLRYGRDGCAASVAAEFGDHPDIAPRRMAWARDTARMAFGAASVAVA